MQKLHFSIQINAPKEKVWDIMLDDKTYREWTTIFMPGSHFEGSQGSSYEGSWEKGSKIQFLAPDENGKMGGMSSEIAENRKYEFISIHHLGVVGDGVEDTTSKDAHDWQGYENYTFEESDGGTKLSVEMDSNDEFKDYFGKTWPKALEKLKEVVER